MKRFCVLAVMLSMFMFTSVATAEYILYENEEEHIRVGWLSEVTGFVGKDLGEGKEELAGLKTSVIEYTGLPLKLNFDLGILGSVKHFDTQEVDGVVGLSVTLPKEIELFGKLCLDAGIGYSPDWIVGPERVFVYAGFKVDIPF